MHSFRDREGAFPTDAPVPYWLMCSGWVLDRRSMASMMAFMPPSLRMDSVERALYLLVNSSARGGCCPAARHVELLPFDK